MTAPDAPTNDVETLDRLDDTDTGRYEVATHTARYCFDLDARRLQRAPRPTPVVPGPGDAPLVPGTVVFGFDVDHGWVDLVELEHCVRGEEMRLHAVVHGQTQPWRTTAVVRIDRR